MNLEILCNALAPVLSGHCGGTCDVSGVFNDSSKVIPGSLFCAVRGSRVDGHHFLDDAGKRGAAAFCVDRDWSGHIPAGRPVLRVSDSYYAWGLLCEAAASRPADSFRVHTVTGTNGKTTIAFVMQHLLNTAGKRSALLSTVRFEPGDGTRQDSFVTMPDAANLQSLFQRIKEAGATDTVMESSSHGLHQHRAGSLKFSSGIFTNLTGDHLDYHKTMENYFQAKKLLFTSMLAPDAPAVIHTQGEYGKRMFQEITGNKLDFSAEDPHAFCFLKHFTPVDDGSILEFILDGHALKWHSPLRGEYNGANLLEAVTAAYALDIDMSILQQGAESAPPAPGRLEPVHLKSGATAFVDYAHTDDALARALDALRKILSPGGRLVAVFGCGGDRDRTKRPRMGKTVSEHADRFVVTSDNPRTEDPNAIIQEILAGIPSGTDFAVEPDRASAIRQAVSMLKENDILLVAGKGHEKYQDVAGVKHHFDDLEILREFAE